MSDPNKKPEKKYSASEWLADFRDALKTYADKDDAKKTRKQDKTKKREIKQRKRSDRNITLNNNTAEELALTATSYFTPVGWGLHFLKQGQEKETPLYEWKKLSYISSERYVDDFSNAMDKKTSEMKFSQDDVPSISPKEAASRLTEIFKNPKEHSLDLEGPQIQKEQAQAKSEAKQLAEKMQVSLSKTSSIQTTPHTASVTRKLSKSQTQGM